MSFIDDVKDNVEDAANDVENKFHEEKGKMEGRKEAEEEHEKDLDDRNREQEKMAEGLPNDDSGFYGEKPRPEDKR